MNLRTTTRPLGLDLDQVSPSAAFARSGHAHSLPCAGGHRCGDFVCPVLSIRQRDSAASHLGLGLGRPDELRSSPLILHQPLGLWSPFSPIHLLSIWTLFSLVMAVYHARNANIRQHKIWMALLYILVLLVTGVFTLWPGRVMYGVLFGV